MTPSPSPSPPTQHPANSTTPTLNNEAASAMTRSTSATSMLSSSSSFTSNPRPSSLPRPTRGRTKKEAQNGTKLIVSSQPLHPSSINALATSIPLTPSDGTRKLSKWLSGRGRTKSVGSTASLGSGSGPTSVPLAPTISVSSSSSSSGISTLAAKGAQGKRGSISSMHAGGSLRTSRRGTREIGDEPIDAGWALEEGDSMDQQQQSPVLVPEENPKPTMRFSLKKTKSSLKLFGRGTVEGEQHGGGILPPDRMGRTSKESVDAALAGTAYDDENSILDLPRSSSSFSIQSPTLNATNHATSPGGGGTNPNVAGRIGGWFSSMLHPSTSSSHLPMDSPSSSPSGKGNNPINLPPAPGSPTSSIRLASPKKGSGGGRLGPLDRMLDKAVQYFLDTDSTADKCEDDIWVLGVRHPGYVPPPLGQGDEEEVLVDDMGDKKRRSLMRSKKGKEKKQDGDSVDSGSGGDSRSRSSSPPIGLNSASSSPSPSPQPSFRLDSPQFPKPLPTTTTHGWPAEFYHDFYSRIALTYRSGFPLIPCSPNNTGGMHGVLNTLSMSIGRGGQGRTSEGLSSDTGWGCMLRTGQSLLANTLLTVHLGRDWRRPLPPLPLPSQAGDPPPFSPPPAPVPQQADYARLLSLFIDDPSPLAPFSVHRFALMGKQLGKEVGEWFGPSTAAGAIKTLVNDFEPAGLKVCSVVDGTVYKSEVENISQEWKSPVLVLIGLRLGIDGVNPIYYESVKTIFSFPQSVGIAGGRPSSSYYFVGAQANSLFYIDPHHPRHSIPLVNPPSELFGAAQSVPLSASLSESTPPTATAGVADSFITVMPSPTTPLVSKRPSSSTGDVKKLAEYFEDAYPDTAMRSYHCDKVRKMAFSSLDPSMLVGFLIKDESDWLDFEARVRQLAQDHKPIFAMADAPPAWMRRSGGATATGGPPTPGVEDDADVDSFSEPDDWELDSTNASGASASASISPGNVSPAQKPMNDEEWEDEGAREPSPPVLISAASHSQSPPTHPPPTQSNTQPAPTALENEDSMVVIKPSHAPVGGAAVLVQRSSPTPAVSFDKREEGWEGVGLQPQRERKASQSPSTSSMSSQEQILYTLAPSTRSTSQNSIRVAT